ncbi:hypothetical protein X801_05787, partial [Opisthorchis viverrini]
MRHVSGQLNIIADTLSRPQFVWPTVNEDIRNSLRCQRSKIIRYSHPPIVTFFQPDF